MTDQKRRYRMSKRAEAEDLTRRRITQSTVALHESRGPSRTSVKAIADHAGVRRSTVYRHFPDELSLFSACTAHWMAANPMPDPEKWTRIADADARLAVALDALYAYYRRTQKMMANIHRDEEIMPLVRQMMGGYRGYLAGAREVLLAGRNGGGMVAAAIGHALSFPAWRSLALGEGLAEGECVELMCRMVRAAG